VSSARRVLAAAVNAQAHAYAFTLAVWSTGSLLITERGAPSAGDVFAFDSTRTRVGGARSVQSTSSPASALDQCARRAWSEPSDDDPLDARGGFAAAKHPRDRASFIVARPARARFVSRRRQLRHEGRRRIGAASQGNRTQPCEGRNARNIRAAVDRLAGVDVAGIRSVLAGTASDRCRLTADEERDRTHADLHEGVV
jgi:hypothetical protein